MNNYVLIKITGKDVKRFTMSLYKMNYNLYNIKYKDNSVYLKISYKDYLKIKEIKTIYEIEIIKLYGFIRIKDILDRYKIFIISIIIGILFMYFLSNIIFEVEVVSEKKEMRDFVIEKLESYGIKKFHFAKGFYKNLDIKNEILSKNRDKIEWMEIERIGTKYLIKVEERKVKVEKNDNVPKDVVSKKRAVILEIQAKSGEVIKKVNDYVNPGDIIITGVIKNKDIIKDLIKADGKIYGETWYKVNVEIPINYKKIDYSGKSHNNIHFKFLNKDITNNKYDKYISNDIITFGNKLLPINFGIFKDKEQTYIDDILTSDNAINLASNIAKDKLLSSLDEDSEIIYEKCLKLDQNNSKISIDIFFKVKENITDYKDIDMSILENNEDN